MAFEEMSRPSGQQGAGSHLQPHAARGGRQPCRGARGESLPLRKGSPKVAGSRGFEQRGDHGVDGGAEE